MVKLLKYIGADEPLGVIERKSGFYWLVHPFEKVNGEKTVSNRVVCHPTWSTEVVDLTDEITKSSENLT